MVPAALDSDSNHDISGSNLVRLGRAGAEKRM